MAARRALALKRAQRRSQAEQLERTFALLPLQNGEGPLCEVAIPCRSVIGCEKHASSNESYGSFRYYLFSLVFPTALRQAHLVMTPVWWTWFMDMTGGANSSAQHANLGARANGARRLDAHLVFTLQARERLDAFFY